MSRILVCRLCLATDVRLDAIANTSLQDVYENLTNIALISMEKPIVACYLCVALLRKCQKFTERVIQADEVLTRMLQAGTEITPKSLALLDCKALKLQIHLEMAPSVVQTLNDFQPLLAIKEEMLSEMEEVTCDEVEVEFETDVHPAKKSKLNRYSIEDPNSTVQEHCVPEKENIEFAAKEDVKEIIINAANEQEKVISHSKQIMKNTRERKKSVHNQKDLNRKFICNYCGKRFNNKLILVIHIKKHSAMKAKVYFPCNLCAYEGITSDSLKRHIRSHNIGTSFHTQDESVQSVKISPQSEIIRKDNLESLLKAHTGEKSYQCDMCQHRFAHKKALTTHFRTHTQEKPYGCTECEYRCSRRGHLKIHLRTHTGAKPYECKVCGYGCSVKSNLQKHLRSHTGEKPYECKVCGYRCNDRSNLQTHVRTHTGEKPYECSECEYRCSRSSLLKIHLRTHTGAKPYQCKVCGYGCSVKSNLQRHLRTHTEEKPFECKVFEFGRN